MPFFKRTIVAGAMALSFAAPASAQFTGLFFFGDSLTDAGSFKPALPPGTGLFTTNPGPIWAQVVGSDLGFSVSPANQGGNDFAQGGARVTNLPGFPANPPTAAAVPVTTQVTQLLARGPLDPNALYFVWAGANDLFVQLGNAAAGTPAAVVQANLATAATELVGQIARLRAAGARYIVVLNMPDVGSTPFGLNSGQRATITSLSSFFNTTMNAGLDATGVQTLRLNIFGLLNEVAANPSLYGFTSATAPACGATASLLCTSANLVAPNAAQTFVFADGVHPTTAGHAVIAQYVEAALRAPQQAAALAEAPLNVEAAAWRALDGRMISAIDAPGRGKFETWVTYGYSNPDMNSGFLSGDGSVNTFSLGLDTKLTQRLLVGVAFDYSEDKVDFFRSGFKLREATGTLYAGYGEGPWYVGGTLGASDLDYRNVHREIPLGATTRTESADARGYATTARAVGGYWFRSANFLHGPNVKLTWQDIVVKAYSEQGQTSTTMAFDQQRRKSLISSLGYQASASYGTWRPFARASWEHEFKDDVREVTTSVVSAGGRFTLPAYQPDKDWALFTLGVSNDFGRVTGFLDATATAGKSDGNGFGITVGVRVPL